MRENLAFLAVGILLGAGAAVYWMRGVTTSQVHVDAMAGVEAIASKVAADAIAQYEIVKRNGGTPLERCARAQIATAALLQSKNESEYANWKKIENADCEAAGFPR